MPDKSHDPEIAPSVPRGTGASLGRTNRTGRRERARRSPSGERPEGLNVFGCRGGQDRVTGRALALALMPFLFLVSASPARATATPDTLRLTLPAAIENALTQGEEMRQADATRATAHALYLQARAGALPHLTLNTTYTHQYESIYGSAGGTAPTWSPDTTAALERRVRDLEDALPGSGFLALSQLFTRSPARTRGVPRWRSGRRSSRGGRSGVRWPRPGTRCEPPGCCRTTGARTSSWACARPTWRRCWPNARPPSRGWAWSRPNCSCAACACARRRATPPSSTCCRPRCSGTTSCRSCGAQPRSGNPRG